MGDNKGRTSLVMNDRRSRLIREVMQLTGESTKSGAIDAALAHYIEDHRQKSKIVTDLDPEIADALSTKYLPMELEYQYSVGIQDED